MPLPRLHLFELEDQPWFPHTIRDFATDYLRFVEAKFALHKPVVPLVRDVLERSGAVQVVDLCSGVMGRDLSPPGCVTLRPAISRGLSLVSDDRMERPGAVKGVPAGTAGANP